MAPWESDTRQSMSPSSSSRAEAMASPPPSATEQVAPPYAPSVFSAFPFLSSLKTPAATSPSLPVPSV